MAAFADIVEARQKLTRLRESRAMLQASAVDLQVRLEFARHRDELLAPTFADPNRAPERALRRMQLERLPGELETVRNNIAATDRDIEELATRLERDTAAQPTLWSSDVPVILFPVRLETCFRRTARGIDLCIRVYPDEIQIDALARQLSDPERSAAQQYWRTVWRSLGQGEALGRDIELAWKDLLRVVAPGRASWAISRMRPTNAPADLGVPDGPVDAQPHFPVVDGSDADTGPVVALLPDRWIAYGVAQDRLLFRAEGSPIRKPLPISVLRQQGRERAAEWLVDFDQAVDAGMALVVPLEGERPSIDQLFVAGYSVDLSPEASAAAVTELLSSHANRRVLEFVPPRAATNNTADAASFWHSNRNEPVAPDTLRLAYTAGSAQNAALLGRALGIDGRDALAGIPNSNEDWQTAAGILLDALWPALTVDWDQLRRNEWQLSGYGASVQQASPYPSEAMDALRSEAVKFVRGRGPLPTLRVGRQPYGVLPVSSLDYWRHGDERPIDAMVLHALRHLRPFWQAALVNVPRVHGRQDQDRALLEVLVQDAVSAKVTFWKAVGHDNYDAPEPLTIIPDLPWPSSLLTRVLDDMPGVYEVPLVGDGDYLKSYWKQRRRIIDECLAAPPANAQTIDDKAKVFLGTQVAHAPPITRTLLYALFNYGQVREEDAISGMEGIAGDPNVFYAERARRQAALLDALDTIPASDLEVLLLETLDLFSHRLDAWITSRATRRLQELRAQTPTGSRIGCYGFVESLTAPEQIGDVGELRERDEDTYILAPSLHHAASAAVLRSGFDSHTDERAFGVNLTSSRARQARWLVDGVRNGQTVGALLGYWLERGLHDVRHDEQIARIRERFPLPALAAQEEAEEAGVSREIISARNVADGLAVYRALTGTSEVPIPADASNLIIELDGIEPVRALLAGLRDLVDAVGDLLLGESVHQLVGGNPLRAGLAADTLGRGESVPARFDLIANPKSGVSLTCSVAAVLPAGAAITTGWNAKRPRAMLSPQAEAWIGGLLGPPSTWRFEADVRTGRESEVVPFTLADLDLCALDVIYEIANDGADTVSVLERRALTHLEAARAVDARVQIAAAESRGTWRVLAAECERIRGVLRSARALQPTDLAPLERVRDLAIDAAALSDRMPAAGSPYGDVIASVEAAAARLAAASPDSRDDAAGNVVLAAVVELAFRVEHYLAGVSGAAAALQRAHELHATAETDAVRSEAARQIVTALHTLAAHGIEGSYPVFEHAAVVETSLLAEQARRILAFIDTADLPADGLEGSGAVSLRAWADEVVAIARRLAGSSFPLAYAFVPPAGGELALNLTAPTRVTDTGYPEIMSWLRRVARVRAPLSDFNDILMVREIRTQTIETLVVIQTPHDPVDDQWAAQDFHGRRPHAAQRTAVLHMPKPIDVRAPMCGWLIDGWTERIPGLASMKSDRSTRSEMAGLSFHFNQPDAQAPHVVLVAVPPDRRHPWTEDILLHIVRETLDLAKMRAIDHRDLPRITPLVPSTYILHADNNGDKWPLEMNPDVM